MGADNYELVQLINDTVKDPGSFHFSTAATIAGVLHPYTNCLMVTRWLLQLKTKSCPRGKEEVGTETKSLPAYYKAFLEYYPATSMSHYLNLGHKPPLDQSLKG